MTKKILIAEDEWELRNLLKLILEEYDLAIAEAEDGEEAIKQAKEFQPELILLDNNMPGLSGYEVIQRLKAIHELKDVPIIMLTGKRFDDGMQQLIKMDVKEFLPKPYEEEKIIAAVKKVFGELPKKTAVPIPAEPTPPAVPPPVPSPEIVIPEISVEVPTPATPSPEITIPEITAEVPTGMSPVPSPEITIPEVTIEAPLPVAPSAPAPPMTPPSPPSPPPTPAQPTPTAAPSPEITLPEITVPTSVSPAPSPEITLPEITQEVSMPQEVPEIDTKFYCIRRVSLKELIVSLCSSQLQIQTPTAPTPSVEERVSGTVLVIAYGQKINLENLTTILEIFTTLPVLIIDYKTFQDKLQTITSSGMEIVEINPAAFKKL